MRLTYPPAKAMQKESDLAMHLILTENQMEILL